MSKDPVCKMGVSDGSKLKSTYGEKTYLFCSSSCKAKFDREPQRYLQQPSKAGGAQSK